MTDFSNHAPVIVVMGVTGSGKTTIGTHLAQRLNLPFYDADDFHPECNRAKLATDVPLSDADREPWLAELANHMKQWATSDGAVLACSALKHRYRSMFRAAAPRVQFVYLEGDPNLIAHRVLQRARFEEHIVKDYANILEGQFRDLEIPTSAVRINIDQSPGEIVDQIVQKIKPEFPPKT